MYSVDDRESFEEVSRLRELVLSVKSTTTTTSSSQGSKKGTTTPSPKVSESESMNNVQNTPLVIVANKCDIEDERRQVSVEFAECECIDWDAAFVESSAKNGDNIMNIFHKLLLQAHLKGMIKTASESSSSEKGSSNRRESFLSKVLRVEKVPKVSNRRRSSLPVSDLFSSTSASASSTGSASKMHLPIFGKRGGEGNVIKEGEEMIAPVISPTTSADHTSTSGRSSCALS